jgi:hypothetical protein
MTVIQVLGLIAGGLVSIGVILKSLVAVYKWANRIDKALGFVEEQMKPNSGSSLRDSLDRIENRLTQVESYITTPR